VHDLVHVDAAALGQLSKQKQRFKSLLSASCQKVMYRGFFVKKCFAHE
jgi:hypothetical protein